MNKSFLNILLLIAIVAVITTSCKSKGDKPGWIYMPDMTYSNAYEAYASTRHQTNDGKEGMSAILPVSGTIPRGYVPNNSKIKTNEKYMNSFVFKNYFKNPILDPSVDYKQRLKAHDMLKNPFKRSDAIMATGKEKFDIYCAVCHGFEGKGDGPIVVRKDGSDGPFVAIPPDFTKANGRLHGLTDGDMFYSITYGKNMMGGYDSQVKPEDRWAIIHYIKEMAGISDEFDAFERNADGQIQMDMSSVELKEGAEINVPDIYFTTGSSDLKSESYYILDQVVSFFNKNKKVIVEIGSHSDSRGDDIKNMTLSQQRALSVVSYLKGKGVSNKQLKPKGYGETSPAVNCTECTPEEYKKN
ncbi:MAG: OmpA family protein, partial [Methanosarcinales archaeon]|nr:OmpA family protein [Methanosarcinales archaeon]